MEKYIDSYTNGWFRTKRKPGKEVPEEDARLNFEKNKLYTAIVKNSCGFYCFLQHSKDFFYVGFLDSLMREYLKYQFNNSEDDCRFFLKEVQYWEFEGDTDKKIHTDIYQFTEKGDITIHKVDVQTREATQLTSTEPIDVSGFYEDFPEFGQYGRLVRKDRMDSLNMSMVNLTPLS